MPRRKKEVMTAEELAEYLSFSKNWIYRKAEAGELPGIKLGNRWRFKKSVIDKWLEERIEKKAPKKIPEEEVKEPTLEESPSP